MKALVVLCALLGVANADAVDDSIKRLGDAKTRDRAVVELEALKDPRAIQPLGEAWLANGRPVEYLRVMIALAKPASFDKAQPYLERAVFEVDENDPRSLDNAAKAAEAMGEGKIEGSIKVLAKTLEKPGSKKTIQLRIAAIRSLGAFAGKPAAAQPLLAALAWPLPAKKSEAYTMYLAQVAASVNALGELREPSAAKPIVVALFRTPEISMQARRALVAIPKSIDAVREMIRGKNKDVEKLVDPATSAREFYGAILLGDRYDKLDIGLLIAMIKKPSKPAYIVDGDPSTVTQHNAAFDTFRKLGGPPQIAKAIQPIVSSSKADAELRLLAIATYPFVSRDDSVTQLMGTIAADNMAEDSLRMESATAYARLAKDASAFSLLNMLAKKYLDASAKKQVEADKLAPDAAKADAELAAAKKTVENAKAAALAASRDPKMSVADIRKATDTAKQAEEAYRTAREVAREKAAPAKYALQAVKDYLGYARMFQTHVARVAIAMQCKDDVGCYGTALDITRDQAAAAMKGKIDDIAKWTDDEKDGLREATIDRAALEISKRSNGNTQIDKLLAHVADPSRLVRQAALLAIPKVAPPSCSNCAAKLAAAIDANKSVTLMSDAVFEMTMLKSYFTP